MNRLIGKIRSMNPWHFLWIAVVLSELFTVVANTIQSYLRWGFLSKDLLLIGAVDALFVPLVVAPIVIYFSWEGKQAEKEASRQKQILEDITQGITESIMLLSKDFKILWANKSALQQTGLSMEELLGNYCYKATHHREQPCETPCDPCAVSELLKKGRPSVEEHTHYDSRGNKLFVEVSAYPIRNADDEIVNFVHISRDITERKRLEEDKEKLVRDLQESLADVKQLSGLLPMCASCKKIRDDEGYWNQVDTFISKHTDASFTHGICPECAKKLYPEHYENIRGKKEKKDTCSEEGLGRE